MVSARVVMSHILSEPTRSQKLVAKQPSSCRKRRGEIERERGGKRGAIGRRKKPLSLSGSQLTPERSLSNAG